MSEKVETLVKIKKVEEEATSKVDVATAKAGEMTEAAKREVEAIMSEAELAADANYVKVIEKAKKEAARIHNDMIEDAKKRASRIKPIGKESAISIFTKLIGKRFGV